MGSSARSTLALRHDYRSSFYDPEYKLYVAIIRCSYERKSGTKVTQTMESLNVICIVERREKQVRVHRLRNRDKISSRLFVSLFLGQFHVPKFERNYSFQFATFVNYRCKSFRMKII